MEQEVIENDVGVDNTLESQEQEGQIKEELSSALSKAFGRKEEVKEVEQHNDVDEKPEENIAEDVESDISPESEGDKEETKEEDLFPVISKDWSKEEQEKFKSALTTPELKEAASVFTDRYEQLKKGFYKKADETANLKKAQSAWDELYDDTAKEQLARRGQTEQQYTKNLLQVDRMLMKDPVDTIKKIMEGYKVTPEQVGFSESKANNTADEEDFFSTDNKQIDQLKNEIAELKNTMKQQETNQVQKQQTTVQNEIRDFEHAIDSNGEPKYPLFKEVKEEMSFFLKSGKASTLEEAYKLSPTVREKELEAKSVASEKAKLEADRKKAQDAKRASRGVSNRKSVPTQTPKGRRSIEQHLRENFKKAGAL